MQYHTKERAEQDAEALYKAGQGKWGTDEEAFIKILLSSPPHYVELLNDVYCRKYGNAIVIAIEKEFGGDAKKALLFYGAWLLIYLRQHLASLFKLDVITNNSVFLTVRLCLDPFQVIAEHFESTMKGLGTDEKALSAAVVRYQPWLAQVSDKYAATYKKSLKERIQGEVSGDYRRLLLALFDAPLQAQP